MSTEANTCATCGKSRGTIETLFGKVCADCEGITVAPAPEGTKPFIGPLPQHLADVGEIEILHGALDL